MTRDEIIKMAKQVCFGTPLTHNGELGHFINGSNYLEELEAFTKLVADRKQEEIIKVIERLGTWAHISEIVNEIRGQA